MALIDKLEKGQVTFSTTGGSIRELENCVQELSGLNLGLQREA